MKKVISLLLVIILFCCSSSEDTSPNDPPSKPNLIYPTDNLFCIDSTIDFQFTTSNDTDGDAISYDIEFSTNASFTEGLIVYTSTSILNTYTLEFGKTYYWRVRAKDSRGLYGEYSDVYSFYTQSQGSINNLPFSQSLIQPINESTVSNNVNLEWSAIDIDGDFLVYDIYLGAENPPENLIAENFSETFYTFQGDNSSIYYWRVVVKDNNGGDTIGQVWQFSIN